MAATGTVALSAEVVPLYDAEYMLQAQSLVVFDQFSNLREVMNGQRGATYRFPIVDNRQPSTAPLNELEDIVPTQMSANEVVTTLQEWGGGVELTKLLAATSYVDVYEQAAYSNGYQLAESFDLIVRAIAGQGNRRYFQNSRTARTQFTGKDTAADRCTPDFLSSLHMRGRATRMPFYDDGSLCTVIHPFLLQDLLANTTIRDMAVRLTPEMLFNGELAYWGGIRIIVSPNAKIFGGAGAVRTSDSAVTTLASAAAVGATSIVVTSATGIAIGEWLAINDAEETGNTWSDTNELFYVTGISGTTITGFAMIEGPGNDGGLRYAHAAGTVVKDNSSVYPIVLFGPNSITKIASDLTGPYGQTVVSEGHDLLGRFLVFGWYALCGWSRTRDGWVPRGECSASEA